MADTNTQRCLACGAPLNAPVQGGKIKCAFCGTVNVVGPREKKKGDEIVCPECGAINPKDAQHCGRCGIKLEFNCPKCGALNSYGTAYCVQCGVDIQGELRRLEEEKRHQEEAIRRQREEAQQRLEEEKRKRRRRRRVTALTVLGIILFGFLCIVGALIVSVYKTSLSPAAQKTNTAAVLEQTAAAARQTATVKYSTLFHDDFSDPSSGWSSSANENGSSGYTSGIYYINVIPTGWLYWSTISGTYQNDVRIEVDASKVDGPDDNSYGIVCRYQDNNNFYYLGISNNGSAAIHRALQGTFSIISSEDGGWKKASGINPGYETNHLRAECIGNTLTLYANGTQVATAIDDSFTSGQVGLGVGTLDTGGVEIMFDDFFVYQP